MSRHDLTDREFNAIRYLLPAQKTKRRGRPWSDHRTVINGILWILHTGSPWRDLPEEFGPWYVIVCHSRTSDLFLVCFAVGATCFVLVTQNRALATFDLYPMIHTPPAALSDRHHERFVFHAMHRDCMVLWFGLITGMLGRSLIRPRRLQGDATTA